jgi:D-glycero-alpha-D-manno-heptose 1-phosphate guanylyltransferase
MFWVVIYVRRTLRRVRRLVLRYKLNGLPEIKECIILAGGLGTRLQKVIPDVPKSMAPIAGKPFIFYLLNFLRQQGIEKFILSLGYKSEVVEEFVNAQFSLPAHRPRVAEAFSGGASLNEEGLNIKFSIEDEPMGTGGGIKLACSKTESKNVLVTNGDTLFKVDVRGMMDFHSQKNAHCTLALKPMQNFSRYGAVELNKDDSISNFREKQFFEMGLINGGIYVLNVPQFLQEELPGKFSFEKDYLEKFYQKRKIFGMIQDEYFIDIGIPEDYARAVEEVDKLKG